jgi:mannose-6-phosphate isomerase-like protein (cupin superfamily)
MLILVLQVCRAAAVTPAQIHRLSQIYHRRESMAGYVTQLEEKTLANKYFREVLFTGPYSQLVVMSIAAGDDIGMETHGDVDQFIRIEAGHAKAILDGKEHLLEDGSAVVIPAGVKHNIVNVSTSEPLQLYSVYTPPEHAPGTIHKTKAEAVAAEKSHHH